MEHSLNKFLVFVVCFTPSDTVRPKTKCCVSSNPTDPIILLPTQIFFTDDLGVGKQSNALNGKNSVTNLLLWLSLISKEPEIVSIYDFINVLGIYFHLYVGKKMKRTAV